MTDPTPTPTPEPSPAPTGTPTPTPPPTPTPEPTPAPTPAPKGKAPAGEAPFYEGFTDPKLKESPVVLRHKTVEDLARSLTAAESKLGVPADQLIRKPTKPEEFADVYRALGAPEKPEDYKIGLPEKATEADKAMAVRFAQTMFEKGPFPPDVVAATIEFINGETQAADEALAEADKTRKAEGEALLKKELGAAYDPDMKAIGKMLADSGIEGLADELDLTRKGDGPLLMLFLHQVMEGRSEPGDLKGNNAGTGGAGLMTPGQAKAARITLENDPVKGAALRDAAHPMHKSVNGERSRYFALEAGRDPDKQT
jgi:hypothetical protein